MSNESGNSKSFLIGRNIRVIFTPINMVYGSIIVAKKTVDDANNKVLDESMQHYESELPSCVATMNAGLTAKQCVELSRFLHFWSSNV